MRRILLAVLAVVIVGCALPRYQTRLVPLVASPSTSESQAAAICGPEAQLAAANARAQTKAQIDSRNNQVTGYTCNTQGSYTPGSYNPSYSSPGSYQGSTNCTSQRAVQARGFAGGFNDATQVRNAGEQAGEAVLQSCLARLGWRTERYCVQNCQ